MRSALWSGAVEEGALATILRSDYAALGSGAKPWRSFSDDIAERLRSSRIWSGAVEEELYVATILRSDSAVPDSGARAEPWRSVSEANSGSTAKSNYC
jgi:hypothetical protein